jgi:predicted phage tail protein
VVSLDGKASTMWSVKMQLNSQGQYVAAGIGLGIENGPAGLQSKFLVSADLFAVINGVNGTLSSPFAVTGGQVFMNSAFIQNGTITNAKIGQVIQSDDYVANTSGWVINKNGGFEMNGTYGGGRMQLTSNALKFYHPNGVLGIDLSL